MTRGKYAAQAKTKRAADGATVTAIREANLLRIEVKRLSHLGNENAELRFVVDKLRQQVDAQEGDELRRLRRVEQEAQRALVEASRTVEELVSDQKAKQAALSMRIATMGLDRPTKDAVQGLVSNVFSPGSKPIPVERKVMRQAGLQPSREDRIMRADVRFVFSKKRLKDSDWLRCQWNLWADSREDTGRGIVSFRKGANA